MEFVLTINSEQFKIANRPHEASGQMVHFYHRDKIVNEWRDTNAGKGWSDAILKMAGGDRGWMEQFLVSVKKSLLSIFSSSPTGRDDIENFMVKLKANLVVNGNTLDVK